MTKPPVYDMAAYELEKELAACEDPDRKKLLLYALTEHRNWKRQQSNSKLK
tara:strand:- start:97 stop:249 length:153 start_codon:yes stop_codon:yes gene_type:complete